MRSQKIHLSVHLFQKRTPHAHESHQHKYIYLYIRIYLSIFIYICVYYVCTMYTRVTRTYEQGVRFYFRWTGGHEIFPSNLRPLFCLKRTEIDFSVSTFVVDSGVDTVQKSGLVILFGWTSITFCPKMSNFLMVLSIFIFNFSNLYIFILYHNSRKLN